MELNIEEISVEIMKKLKVLFNRVIGTGLCLFTSSVFAADNTLGTVASGITKTFANITLLITGGSYIAGLGFAIGAIVKFKQHKENPTQTQLGTPITFLVIAAALLFLPSVLDVAGNTLFGSGTVAGPSGDIYGISSGK